MLGEFFLDSTEVGEILVYSFFVSGSLTRISFRAGKGTFLNGNPMKGFLGCIFPLYRVLPSLAGNKGTSIPSGDLGLETNLEKGILQSLLCPLKSRFFGTAFPPLWGRDPFPLKKAAHIAFSKNGPCPFVVLILFKVSLTLRTAECP